MTMLVNFATCEKLLPLYVVDKEFPVMAKLYINDKRVEALVSMGGEWILIKPDKDRREVYKYDLDEYHDIDVDMQGFIENKVNIPTGELCYNSTWYKKFMKYKHHFEMVSAHNFKELKRKDGSV